VLLSLDRDVEVFDRASGRSLARRAFRGGDLAGAARFEGDGASVRVFDQRLAIPGGALTDIPEDEDPVLGDMPLDDPTQFADGTLVRCRAGALEHAGADGTVLRSHAGACVGNERLVVGHSPDVVFAVESSRLLRLADGDWTRISYVRAADETLHVILETSEGFVVSSAIVDTLWYRPAGPALSTEPVPAREHVRVREPTRTTAHESAQ
jgi:hypothetical protein